MFIVMLVGYFLRKGGIIDAAFSKKLSKLVLNVTQPVLIVTSMMKMEMTAEGTKLLGKILLVSLLVHSFAAVLGWLTMLFLKPSTARKLSEHSIIFTNVMFFGLPIVSSLFGPETETWASFYSIVFHVFAWTYGMMILGRERDDIKLNPRKIFLNFGTVPCAIGAICYLLNLGTRLSEWNLGGITTAMGYIGSLCTPVSLLVLGGVLATYPMKRLFGDWKIYYTAFIKLLVMPMAVFMIVRYGFGLDMKLSMFSTIMAALPTASITNMFAELYEIEPGYAATSVGMTTALSVGSLPLVVFLAQTIDQLMANVPSLVSIVMGLF